MKNIQRMLALCFCVLALAQAARTQDKAKTEMAAPTTGFRAELLKDFSDVESKVVDLAKAMPQEKYTWRPMADVRSVCEVYIHIAVWNYLFPKYMGMKAPEGISEDMEKTISEKRKATEMLTESFKNFREAIINTSDADLEKQVKVFGQDMTYRALLMSAVTHMHEHLGQSIAYARMNGVVPPWTAAEQAALKKEQQKK